MKILLLQRAESADDAKSCTNRFWSFYNCRAWFQSSKPCWLWTGVYIYRRQPYSAAYLRLLPTARHSEQRFCSSKHSSIGYWPNHRWKLPNIPADRLPHPNQANLGRKYPDRHSHRSCRRSRISAQPPVAALNKDMHPSTAQRCPLRPASTSRCRPCRQVHSHRFRLTKSYHHYCHHRPAQQYNIPW